MLVDSASLLAKMFGVPSFIIGLSVVAFGTSAPELMIGILSGIQKTNLVTLGNVIGSCILNIALVLGLTAIIHPFKVDRSVKLKELPILILIEAVFIFLAINGPSISRLDGLILLLGFLVLLFYLIANSKNAGFDVEEKPRCKKTGLFNKDPEKKKRQFIINKTVVLVLGLAGLTAGGNLVVNSSRSIAQSFGLSEALIGLTVVSIGTTLPELVTSLVAALKKEMDICVGNIIGSNMFNILFIIGVSSSIYPIPVSGGVYSDLFIMIATACFFWLLSFSRKGMSRLSGVLLVLSYIFYLLTRIFFV